MSASHLHAWNQAVAQARQEGHQGQARVGSALHQRAMELLRPPQTASPAGMAAVTAAAFDSPPDATASTPTSIARRLLYTQAAATPSSTGSYMGSNVTRRLNTLFASRAAMDDPNMINTVADTVESSDPKAVRQWLSSLPIRRRKEFMATFGGVLAANPAEAMELFQGAENENYRRLSQVPQGVLKKRRPL